MRELIREDELRVFEANDVKVPENLFESLDFLNYLAPSLLGPDSDGIMWQSRGGAAGPYPPQANILLYVISSEYFSRLQRWIGQYLFKTSSYALTAVENLCTLVIGTDYSFVCDSDSLQRQVDEWFEGQGTENYCDYAGRALECFSRTLVQGETFLRIFGTGPSSRVRFVEPDFVYSNSGYDKGINLDPRDYETVLDYTVNARSLSATAMMDATWQAQGAVEPEKVPAAEMQHRKVNSWTNERRGFSFFLPIYRAVMDAEALLRSVVTQADVRQRIAAIRNLNAPKEAAANLLSDIQSQIQKITPAAPGPGDALVSNPVNIIQYPVGSILTMGKNQQLEFPHANIEGKETVEVLRAVLRQIATRFDLPEAILSSDSDQMAAYTASLVQNSYLVKAMERWQAQIWQWDSLLLKKVGFDTKKIHPVFPQVAITNKKDDVEMYEFALDRGLASNHTIAGALGFDYDDECEIRKKEEAEDPDAHPSPLKDTADEIEPGQPSKDKGI